MATPTQIKDRIVTMLAQVEGVTTSLDDYQAQDAPFTDAQLPVAVTRLVSTQQGPVTATRTHIAAGIILERWQIPIILHVKRASNTDVLSPNTAEMEACEPFLRSIPLFFLQHPRLKPALVYDTEPMANTGIVRIDRPGIVYWGIVFNLPVLEEVTYG